MVRPNEPVPTTQQRYPDVQPDNVARFFHDNERAESEVARKGYDDSKMGKMKPEEAHKILGI